MPYQTIVLELIQQREEWPRQLLANRTLLDTAARYAKTLRTLHQEWIETLSDSQPDLDETSRKAAALELALQDLQEIFNSAAEEQAEQESLSLTAAMTFLQASKPNS